MVSVLPLYEINKQGYATRFSGMFMLPSRGWFGFTVGVLKFHRDDHGIVLVGLALDRFETGRVVQQLRDTIHLFGQRQAGHDPGKRDLVVGR